MEHHLVNHYQVCSNYTLEQKNWSALGVTLAYVNLTFSEYGHVAYRIKGNKVYNYMLASVLTLHTSLTPGRSNSHFFCKSSCCMSN